MDKPTPQTDAWLERIGASYGWADFARALERDRDRLREALEAVIVAEFGPEYETHVQINNSRLWLKARAALSKEGK